MLFTLFFPIIISFLIGVLLLFKRHDKGFSKIILGIFFLFFSFALFAISLNFLLDFLKSIATIFKYVEVFFYSVMLSLPVLVFLYIRSLVHHHDEGFGKDIWVHFFIPIQALLFNLIPLIVDSNVEDLSKKLDYTNFFSLKVTFILMNIYYLIKAYKVFKMNSNRIKEEYSYQAGIQFKWISFFISGYIVFIICFFGLNPNASPFVVYIPFLMISFYFYFQRFNQNPIELQFSDETLSKKEIQNGLTELKRKEILKNLVEFVEKNEIYLKKDLTIHDISKEININSSYISNVLNQDLKCNFVTFINTYRINKAKEILLSRNYSNYTIEAISELVGFNSKSSFNNAFKQISGITPSEFKKENK